MVFSFFEFFIFLNSPDLAELKTPVRFDLFSSWMFANESYKMNHLTWVIQQKSVGDDSEQFNLSCDKLEVSFSSRWTIFSY